MTGHRKAAWIAVRFPYFPLEVLGVDVRTDSVVLASRKNTVCSASECCINEGVKLHMPISTAQLMLECRVLKRDAKAEAQALRDLCSQLYAYTPYINPYIAEPKSDTSEQGVLLEVSRCERLFGGFNNLQEKINTSLSSMPFTYACATSGSDKTAWLLTYAEESAEQSIAAPSSTTQSNTTQITELDRLLALPVTLLHEFPGESIALQKIGFRCLGDIWCQLKKGGLASFRKRFPLIFVEYLSEIFNPFLDDKEGQQDFFSGPLFSTSPEVYSPQKDYIDTLYFDYPIATVELLLEPMKKLLQNLSDYLVANQKHCAGIQWKFSDIYHNSDTLDVRCECVYRDWKLLFELTQIQISQRDLPFEVDQIALVKPHLLEIDLETEALFLAQSSDAKASAGIRSPSDVDGLVVIKDKSVKRIKTKEEQVTVARVQSRLGDNNVFKVTYMDDHVPELSHKKCNVNDTINIPLSGQHEHTPRPDWLLQTPVSIGCNQNNLRWHGSVQLIRGPERVHAHWWDKPTERDYFVAVREDHIRLWVFNDLQTKEWFVQGVF